MTETAFYILFCLRQPNHGYGVVQTVDRMTDGEVKLAPGTMYGSLAKMENSEIARGGQTQALRIDRAGRELLKLEFKRIERYTERAGGK